MKAAAVSNLNGLKARFALLGRLFDEGIDTLFIAGDISGSGYPEDQRAEVMVIDWREFGPPVDVWKQILRMAGPSDTWYGQLTFSFAKQPRMPVMPGGGDAK